MKALKSHSLIVFKLRHLLFIILTTGALVANVAAQTNARKLRVAVLDLGTTETAQHVGDKLSRSLFKDETLMMIDREESRAAARGLGYEGSLNMTLQEARDLGGALGCDFFLTGDAQTLRRSPSTGVVHYEAYASVFIVSARTGRLVLWDRPSFEAASPTEAENSLLKELLLRTRRYADQIHKAAAAEQQERESLLARVGGAPSSIEDAPDDEETAARQGLRLPHPFRRLRPVYPETAARADAEATVDVQVEISAEGKVERVEIVRWAGFGLDDATESTVRRLQFRPAIRDGVAVPVRILLRYNFRKPPK